MTRCSACARFVAVVGRCPRAPGGRGGAGRRGHAGRRRVPARARGGAGCAAPAAARGPPRASQRAPAHATLQGLCQLAYRITILTLFLIMVIDNIFYVEQFFYGSTM